MITSDRIRILLSLFAVIFCLEPSGVSPSPVGQQSPATPDPPSFIHHRWPTENPLYSSREGCGYVTPTVAAVMGEFRTDNGVHYHGGVDIPDPRGNYVYGVVQDLVFTKEVRSGNVGLKVLWNTNEESYYRYVHVEPDPDLLDNYEVVWDPSATGPYYDSIVGWWKYPVHLPLGTVQPSPTNHDHVHFEENWRVPSNGWWIRFNPLYFLCPWSDFDNPQIEDVYAYDNSGSRITRGQGTASHPWIVTGNFDLRLHAHDVLPNRSAYKAGICATTVGVKDPYGYDPLPASPELGQLFQYLPRQDTETYSVVTTGILWTYDTYASSDDNYYYWPTSTYDESMGGTAWKIRTTYLTPYTKYKVAVSCADFDWNWADDTVWVMYDNGTCSCPHQGDIRQNGAIDASDVLQSIKIVFLNYTDVQDPNCLTTRTDVNNDGVADVNDVLYIINTAFINGPNPVNPCAL